MLLKKMNLENFRQFIGTQSIDFSTEPDRNVTIILGENGSGKTTLAQAFTWCLYGDTDFDDKNVLNKKVAQKIGPNGEASVKVELNLKHMEIEYTIIREQKYTTDATGNLKRPNNSVFKIAYRNSDGQQEFIRENETEVRMKQILPKELSKYFFFDGERIGNMSKEIKKGKSPEFAEAVKSLLGLSAFTAALDHLNGRSSSSVIKSYDEDYDSKSDSKIARYREEMKKYEDRLAVIEKRLEEIDNEELTAKEKQKEYEIKLVENKDSEKLANERTHLLDKIKRLEESKIRNTHSILENFNKSGAFWMSSKLINDALEELANADKLDTGIPDIHARTIQYLLGRKKCICGADIEFGSSAYTELNRLLDYIPPKSIGTIIAQFTRECELKCKSTDEKYNIQVVVDDFDGYVGDIETSTAQSISVIFAFIAGVIQLARENNNEENSMLMTEAYPLVMDAPLSAFDKTRIKTVCDALPKVAEQVIIFIKDTDGEIAETNMGAKVGKRYSFHKLNEFETELERR